MATKGVQPIKPEDIVNHQGINEEEAVEQLVDYINGILSLPTSVSYLLRGEAIDVYDNSSSVAWAFFRKQAFARFEAAGWHIKPAEIYDHFYFRLPENGRVE